MQKGLRRFLSSLPALICTTMLVFAQDQTPASPAATSAPTFHAETKLVLVDTVVTDKKGAYIHDLTAKDFRVYEDGKEQTIKSFSYEADPATPENSRPHYMVLFFDNSSTELADQINARQAAVNFIDSNAGPNRLMAIVNFGGALSIAQNFTSDADRLKKVVAGLSRSYVASNSELASMGAVALSSAELDFGQYTTLRALRGLAKSLAAVPGRKILIFLSAGFGITADTTPDLTAAIDACNKANVAVYPVDVRGLVAPTKMPSTGALYPSQNPASAPETGQLKLASLIYGGSAQGFLRPAAFFQAGGKPGGGGAPRPPTGGTVRPPATTTRPPTVYQNPMSRPRIIPPFPESTTTNQQLFYALASGTGGFVITNTNDLLSGMQKISAEQNQYYVLGYSPTDSPEGSCHALKVKVDRGDTVIRARSGYCSVKSTDLLAGTTTSKTLEARATSEQGGKYQSSLIAPFFYTAPNVARVDVTMQIPAEAMKIEKEKGKYRASVDLLGVAVTKDGQVAARFSDTVKLDFQNKDELETFTQKPYSYEKQFSVPSGDFQLKVVFSSGGESFGKVETPLVIEPNNGKQFAVSGVALSNTLLNLKDNPAEAEDALLEDRTPLIVNHMQIVPSATNQFKKADMAVLYVEVYEPLLKSEKPPIVVVEYRVLDRKSGAVKFDSGLMNMAPSIHPGDPVIPIGLKLVTDKLEPGDYRLELTTKDSAGNSSLVRTADFRME